MQAWARLGFAAGGIVYVVIGILALLVAYANRGRVQGPEGALERIAVQPFGHVLLIVVMVGLFGYAAWCFIQAFFDTDHDGSDLKGVAVRIGEFFSGIAYLGLGVLAFHRVRGQAAGGNAAAHWTAKVLAHAWGQWVIAFLGLVFVGVGIGLVVYARQEKFRQYLELAGTNGSDRKWMIRFGKWGYSAQGVVFCIIGAFLVSAAMNSDAQRARGLDGALQWLAQQAYGPWLLAIVAAGLGAFGLFMLVEARYRRLT